MHRGWGTAQGWTCLGVAVPQGVGKNKEAVLYVEAKLVLKVNYTNNGISLILFNHEPAIAP